MQLLSILQDQSSKRLIQGAAAGAVITMIAGGRLVVRKHNGKTG